MLQTQVIAVACEFGEQECVATPCRTWRRFFELSDDGAFQFAVRPDVVNLLGDPSKAKRDLGWNPAKTSFEELVRLMVESDMEKVKSE